MRLLALDVGEKRIGTAMSDPLGITAQGAGVMVRGTIDETIARISDISAKNEIGAVIVGLPLSMDGSKGKSAANVEAFAEKLKRAIAVPVILWDERLTTAEGDRLMRDAGLSRKKRAGRLDEIAAQLILQSYLDSHGYKLETLNSKPETNPKHETRN